MRRLLWLLFCFVLPLALVVFPDSAFAQTYFETESEAYSACTQMLDPFLAQGSGFSGSCKLVGSPNSPTPDTSCSYPQQLLSSAVYTLYEGGPGQTPSATYSYHWCVPATCTAGTSPGGQSDYTMADPGGFIGGGGVVDQGGCCATLALQQGSWSSVDKSDATATGHFVLNGSRCAADYSGSGGTLPTPPVLKPYSPHCPAGKASCYNPWDNNFCSQSESGEWFCIPKDNPPPGGCISGATGSECYSKDGNPVPPPPDPPIKSGTPPDSTNNYTINNGGTTNNYTTNNYSGTSPGPGSSSSGGTSPPSSSPGGTGSNTAGNGNSGTNGTDSNGNCPNGSKPTASGCSGTYRDDGCDTPPACFGDAVLCGIAANTHKTACEAASGSSTGAPPSGMGDGTDNSGDPTASSVSGEVDTGDTSSLNSSGFGFSTACPLTDGIHFSFLGQSIDVDESSMCTPLGFIYYIVLAFAYLSAAKIVAGVK